MKKDKDIPIANTAAAFLNVLSITLGHDIIALLLWLGLFHAAFSSLKSQVLMLINLQNRREINAICIPWGLVLGPVH